MGHNNGSKLMVGAHGGSVHTSNRNGSLNNQARVTNDVGQLGTERSGLTPVNPAHSSSL
jgi:hypothetical protein